MKLQLIKSAILYLYIFFGIYIFVYFYAISTLRWSELNDISNLLNKISYSSLVDEKTRLEGEILLNMVGEISQ